ncbi:Ankyrin repeats (3 copies) [Phytophthora infestans]|uniref:Ankyrin repeats (3 copies) n=1 Tax=Phytophthora infestans TaxID=4787 RepID=A0A833T8U9_PHYIN|nr:Ankyrin repeats (3 copies) [Phytophthora infestans]
MLSSVERAWMGAAASGDVETLRSLLEGHWALLNARLDHQTYKQLTALHLAVWKGHSDAVEFLIDHGADMELQDKTGMTALLIDVMRICLEKMRPTVLMRSWCVDVKSPAGLQRRVVHDRSTYREIDTSVLDLLLGYNASVNELDESGDTVLMNAVEYGLVKHVETLLEHGADAYILDRKGRSALDIACEHGFLDIVNVLVETCPNLEKSLVMAVRSEASEILEMLYDRVQGCASRDDPSKLGGHLLLIAAEFDAPECANFLLKRGIPVDWTDSKGVSVLQIACVQGRTEILELLLNENPGNQTKKIEIGRISTNVATLTHPLIKLGILQNEHDVNSHQNRRHRFPGFDSLNIPANMAIMEVLLRNGATFNFPTGRSRDSITTLLASLLLLVSSVDVSKLLVDLANSGALRHKLRHVILALSWPNHTYEALSARITTRLLDFQALAVLEPWLSRCSVTLVTRKLLTDALTLTKVAIWSSPNTNTGTTVAPTFAGVTSVISVWYFALGRSVVVITVIAVAEDALCIQVAT